MVSEFELPCSDCGTPLVRAELTTGDGRSLVVAECPQCGSHHYPESTLQAL